MNPLMVKFDSFYFRIFPMLLIAVFFSVTLNSLSMMQLGGLLGYGGAFVTSLFAISALMYARARAVSDAEEMHQRARIADESLKAALLAVMGFGITSYIFMALANTYKARPGHFLDYKTGGPDLVPFYVASTCIVLFAVPIAVKIKLVVEMTVEDMGLQISQANRDTRNSADA